MSRKFPPPDVVLLSKAAIYDVIHRKPPRVFDDLINKCLHMWNKRDWTLVMMHLIAEINTGKKQRYQ